jgi:hypothetical protein
VPSVVASPYSKPHDVTNVVHDHTSVLATIEAKWNLPACTYRDANAATIADFLDTSSKPALLEPPVLVGAGDVLGGELDCKPLDPTFKVLPAPPPPPKPPRLILRVEGYRHKAHGIVVDLHTSSGALTGLELEVVHRGRVIARRRIARVTTHWRRLVVHHRLARGAYTVRVRHSDRTVAHGELRVR